MLTPSPPVCMPKAESVDELPAKGGKECSEFGLDKPLIPLGRTGIGGLVLGSKGGRRDEPGGPKGVIKEECLVGEGRWEGGCDGGLIVVMVGEVICEWFSSRVRKVKVSREGKLGMSSGGEACTAGD
jgi:hypothetical protein